MAQMTILQKLGHAIHQKPGLENFLDLALRPVEILAKKPPFGCHMCGQCVLHSTGMVCPMNCPKNLRNGPCGGVRANGNCEVIPEMPCVWVQAWERSRDMPIYGDEIMWIQPPVNRALQDTSSWINMAEGIDAVVPPGWQMASPGQRDEMKVEAPA